LPALGLFATASKPDTLVNRSFGSFSPIGWVARVMPGELPTGTQIAEPFTDSHSKSFTKEKANQAPIPFQQFQAQEQSLPRRMNMSQETHLMKDLNDALALEWSTILQYLQHASSLSKPDSISIAEMLRSLAVEEIPIANKIGEKIVSLGGIPTDRVEPIKIADNWRDMVNQDLSGEQLAISDFRDLMDDYRDEPGIRELMNEVITAKERQANRLERLLAA
jgi:bacterioferritin